MARIRVNWRQPEYTGMELDAEPHSWGWSALTPKGWAVFLHEEVRVLGRHSVGVDPQHPGELEPDAYDRMRYKYNEYGRHLLHTGTE
jgi:hypothetical protein